MNALIKNDFFEKSEMRQELRNKIMSLPLGGEFRDTDGQMKYVGVMEAYKLLNLNASTLLDIGCGTTYTGSYKSRCKIYM